MNSPVVSYVGLPTGPMKFIPEFGCEVPTFVEKPGGKSPALTYHVPPNMRGDYRPNELANYDPKKQYRVDYNGKVLCRNKIKSGDDCSKRAVNRTFDCDFHGGRLHPLDKVLPDKEKAANEQEAQAISRYKQFLAGQIGVDDLDDEELACCGFRMPNGRIYKPRNVPRELAQGFQRAIYDRAQRELRSLTVEAAQTMGEIMKNKNVEPDIRLKAALSIIERNLGKTPQVIAVAETRAYEEVFDGILSVSRDESRAARGIESSSAAIESANNTIDAEVVEPEPLGTERVQDGEGLSLKDIGVQSPVSSGNVENTEAKQDDSNIVAGIDNGNGSNYAGNDEIGSNARAFERNIAVMAPVVEIKPFEYDLSDRSDDIKKETRKRYAKRALETQPDISFEWIKTPLNNGHTHVVVDSTKLPKRKTESKSKVAQRKSYTLSDFS